MSGTDLLPDFYEQQPLAKTLHTNLRWLRRPFKLCNCTRKAWVRVAGDRHNVPYCFDCGITAALQVDVPQPVKPPKSLTHHTWENK